MNVKRGHRKKIRELSREFQTFPIPGNAGAGRAGPAPRVIHENGAQEESGWAGITPGSREKQLPALPAGAAHGEGSRTP